MAAPVLVTGATGNGGGAVTRSLLAAGMAVRVAGTNPTALRKRFPGVPAARLDLRDPRTFHAALDGASGLFLLRPPQIARVGPTLNALVEPPRTAAPSKSCSPRSSVPSATRHCPITA
ncbi:hypothetical protein [Micromonospora sp. M71_S20]|uniref:hypothetical protein n=1 Tax=Micromonospora sp. M71_S20 TaxID=592872 RepID=UPI001F491377|nr:hypothetical protein [Micromonospora sp. M71_S20]